MALFNFNRPSQNTETIQLIVNDETVDVPMSEAQGMTVQQVFDRFAASICEVGRINRYINAGRIVPGTTPVEGGTVYAGAIASESKGLY